MMSYETAPRQRFETEADLENELRVARAVQSVLVKRGRPCRFAKIEGMHPHDFWFYRADGSRWFLLEAKVCNHASRDILYNRKNEQCYYLQKHKFDKMQHEAIAFSTLSYFCVEMHDGYFMCRISPLKIERLEVHVVGRTDRDGRDKQASVFIPFTKHFQYILPPQY